MLWNLSALHYTTESHPCKHGRAHFRWRSPRQQGKKRRSPFRRYRHFTGNWLRVFKRANPAHLCSGHTPERETGPLPSEKCVARCGSEYDEIRMSTVRFARVLERCTGHLCMHFLFIFQEVRAISKTRKKFNMNHWEVLGWTRAGGRGMVGPQGGRRGNTSGKGGWGKLGRLAGACVRVGRAKTPQRGRRSRVRRFLWPSEIRKATACHRPGGGHRCQRSCCGCRVRYGEHLSWRLVVRSASPRDLRRGRECKH